MQQGEGRGEGVGNRGESCGREQEPEQAADGREQEWFCNCTAHQLRGAGTHGGADGGLMLAAGGAGEQQIGDVDAADEEHGGHGGEEHEQRVAA